MTEFSSLRQRAGLSIPEAAVRLGYTERQIYRWEEGGPPRNGVLELLRNIKSSKQKNDYAAPAFKFIDLFAGIGGLRLGFDAIGGKCVFTCEWNKYSQETYRANFPGDDHEIAE